MKITAADLFCGAGGTSSGLALACAELGIDLDLVAVNHWQTAIATHSKNHPEAQHICAALESLDPRALVPSGKLDLLVASPECTHFSTARGGKPVTDQKRSSPYLILRWAEALRIDRILIENVPEFRTWGPIGVNGRPLKSKKGSLFHHFLEGLRALGYQVEHRVLNAADYGDPTTRRRLFIVARLGRTPLRWPEPTHSHDGGKTVFGPTKKWRAAREVIDWSVPGQSIFARKKPLAPATMRRIIAGLEKFGGEALKPFLVVLRNHADGRSVEDPVPSIAAAGSHMGLAEPFLMHTTHSRDTGRAHSIESPVPTITTAKRGEMALIEPFVLQQQSGGVAREVREPLPTIAAKGAVALVEPFLISAGGPKVAARSVSEPANTVMTRDHMALVEPFLVPLYGEREGQEPRTHSVDEPVPTIPASGGGKFGVVEPAPFHFANRTNNAPKSIDEPIPSLCTGDHIAIVEPHLVKFYGTGRPASVDEPAPTITAKDRLGLVTGEREGIALDIRFRMLQPHELAAAMSFPKDYEFTGNREARVRQIGNAVPVQLARALCAALLADVKVTVARPRRVVA